MAEETVRRHRTAFDKTPGVSDALEDGGEIAYRRRGEVHQWTPTTMSLLHRAVRDQHRVCMSYPSPAAPINLLQYMILELKLLLVDYMKN